MSDAVSVAPASSLRGALHVPGDKSASHRALILSALADGASTITGLSPGQDVAATALVVRELGADVNGDGGVVVVTGPSAGLRASTHDLECANSGTTMRLVAGVVSALVGRHRLVGDASLSRRPMDRVAAPLRLMGADVEGEGPRVCAPLVVTGSAGLRAIEYAVPVASAQVKSAVLLAGLSASGHTTVHESVRTRTTTEEMMRHAGVTVHSVDHEEGRSVTLTPGRPRPTTWDVPGDPSQAAFFAVLGAIHRDAALTILGVDAAPERVGYVDVLERMGARVVLLAGDRGASLTSASADLTATEVTSDEIPSVDEVPVLTVAAAAARGVSAFRNMSELRVKESDRFAASMDLARRLGCRVWDEGDDFFVEGLGSAARFRAVDLDAGLDHRIVMAAAVAGAAGAGATISGASTVASSYPHFFDDLASLQ